jgi:hypothetical protein
MQVQGTKDTEMKDEEATDLDWLLLESFCKQIFGQDYRFIKPVFDVNVKDSITEVNNES